MAGAIENKSISASVEVEVEAELDKLHFRIPGNIYMANIHQDGNSIRKIHVVSSNRVCSTH